MRLECREGGAAFVVGNLAQLAHTDVVHSVRLEPPRFKFGFRCSLGVSFCLATIEDGASVDDEESRIVFADLQNGGARSNDFVGRAFLHFDGLLAISARSALASIQVFYAAIQIAGCFLFPLLDSRGRGNS